MLRIGLYLATNFAVLMVLSIVLQVLGVDRQSTGGMVVFAAIFGMGGSFISLLLSKSMAKRAMGAQVIEQPRSATERWLVDTVARQAQAAGIGMPEVAVFDSPSPNAFDQRVQGAARLRIGRALQRMNRGESKPCSAQKSATWPTATW